jgi:hypothetical protein
MGTGRSYERKGDPFTLSVSRGEGPPCVIHWQNSSTGRAYFTRVPVHRCYRLDALTVAQSIKEHAQRIKQHQGEAVDALQLAQVLAFDWHPQGQRLSVRAHHEPKQLRAEVRVSIETTRTGRAEAPGVRYWLTCPRCSRRCGALFASPWDEHGVKSAGQAVTGCRVCLGLTDESRQSHKCLHWASAVLGQRPYKVDPCGRYRRRGVMTHERAHRVFMASFGRAFKGLGLTMPD